MRSLLTIFALAGIAGLILLVSFGSSSPAEAQEGEIRVLAHSVENLYPDRVKFFVEATGPDEITEIRVYMKTIGQTTRSAYREVEFEPGTSVSGEAELLSGGNNYFPPGTRMAYSFEIRDSADRVLRTDDVIFVYLDTRFEWFTVSDGVITVYYNNPLVERRAEVVLEAARATLELMGPVLGIQPEHPLHIVTYHNYRDMIAAVPFRSRTTQEQLITKGVAFDEERVLLVYSGDQEVIGTTAHEFTHLLVGDALGRAYSQVPSWLNEGLAEYSDFTHDRDFDQARAAGRIRPLWHLQSKSGTPEGILIVYVQGEAVVKYMISTYGEAKMAELMQALTKTLDIDDALEQVYGFDQYGLDSAWRQSLGLETLPPPQEATPRPRLAPTSTLIPDSSPGTMPGSEPVPTPGSMPSTEAAPVRAQESGPTELSTPALLTEPGQAAAAGPDAAAAPNSESASSRAVSSSSQAEPGPGTASGGCSAPLSSNRAGSELAFLVLLFSPLAMLSALRAKGRKT